MKPFKKLVIIPILLIAVYSKAQLNITHQLGEENSMVSNTEFKKIIGVDESGIYAMLENAPKIIRYDHNFKEIKFNILTQETELKQRKLEFIVHSNDKLWLFSSLSVKYENAKVLYVETMNKETLMPDENRKEVVTIRSTFPEPGGFRMQFSADKSKLLIYCDYPYVKTAHEKFGLCVLDADMNKLWEKVVTIPMPEEKVVGIGSFSIENNGDVLIAGATFEDKAKASVNDWKGSAGIYFNELQKAAIQKQFKYDYWVRKYNGEKDSPDEYSILLDNASVRNMKMMEDQKGNIIVTGFTSAPGNLNVSGYYFIRIDKEQRKIITKKQVNFSSEFLRAGMNPKELAKLEKSFSDKSNKDPFQIDIHHVIEKEDGSFLLVGQQYFNLLAWGDQMNETDLVSRIKQHSYYTDINVISLNQDGDLKWTARVPKKYHVTNDPGAILSSYCMAQTKDNLYFILNNTQVNLNKAPMDNMIAVDAKGGQTVTMLFRVDKTGKVDQKILFGSLEEKVKFQPKVVLQKDEKTLLFIAQRFTKVKLGKVMLE